MFPLQRSSIHIDTSDHNQSSETISTSKTNIQSTHASRYPKRNHKPPDRYFWLVYLSKEELMYYYGYSCMVNYDCNYVTIHWACSVVYWTSCQYSVLSCISCLWVYYWVLLLLLLMPNTLQWTSQKDHFLHTISIFNDLYFRG